MTKYKPIADKVLIEPTEVSDRTQGGMILPDIEQERLKSGKVVAVGPGRGTENGLVLNPQVSVGETVWFNKGNVHEITLDDKLYYIGRELDLFLRQ